MSIYRPDKGLLREPTQIYIGAPHRAALESFVAERQAALAKATGNPKTRFSLGNAIEELIEDGITHAALKRYMTARDRKRGAENG